MNELTALISWLGGFAGGALACYLVMRRRTWQPEPPTRIRLVVMPRRALPEVDTRPLLTGGLDAWDRSRYDRDVNNRLRIISRQNDLSA